MRTCSNRHDSTPCSSQWVNLIIHGFIGNVWITLAVPVSQWHGAMLEIACEVRGHIINDLHLEKKFGKYKQTKCKPSKANVSSSWQTGTRNRFCCSSSLSMEKISFSANILVTARLSCFCAVFWFGKRRRDRRISSLWLAEVDSAGTRNPLSCLLFIFCKQNAPQYEYSLNIPLFCW